MIKIREALEFYDYELDMDKPEFYSSKLIDDKGRLAFAALNRIDEIEVKLDGMKKGFEGCKDPIDKIVIQEYNAAIKQVQKMMGFK